MRIGARRAAATLFALALPAPAVAHAAIPNDPEFVTSGGMRTPWVQAIRWTPPPAGIGWPTIAVVDSGLSRDLDDFQGYLDDQSADCTHGPRARATSNPMAVNDTFGHGTRVATIAAAPANGKGTVGVSPDSQLIVVKFTNADSNFNPVCAFNYLAGIARSGQLLVVNLSFTIGQPTPGAQHALQALIRAGALVVAASGNTSAPVQWPAREPHVLAVGRSDGNASNSSGGPRLDLVAPGANLNLPDVRDRGRFHVISESEAGTSFAAPMVAGVAARVWGTYDEVGDPQVIAYLMRLKAKHLKGVSRKQQGFGRVDLTAATSVRASQVPSTDEAEPNDGPTTATRSMPCRTACKLHGIVVSSDDNFDYWRLARRRCPRGKIRSTNHARVGVGCFRVHGRVYVKVSARKNSQAAYTIAVPRR